MADAAQRPLCVRGRRARGAPASSRPLARATAFLTRIFLHNVAAAAVRPTPGEYPAKRREGSEVSRLWIGVGKERFQNF
eukprot:scaffold30_cov255-Pinguiococcus_pyrenoidosus.AAC.25